MNWTMFGVITVVTLLVSAGMFATFSSARDTYSFKEHYTQKGFSQELPEDLRQWEEKAGSQLDQEPVSEWPTEL